jgi:hypothetical protein
MANEFNLGGLLGLTPEQARMMDVEREQQQIRNQTSALQRPAIAQSALGQAANLGRTFGLTSEGMYEQLARKQQEQTAIKLAQEKAKMEAFQNKLKDASVDDLERIYQNNIATSPKLAEMAKQLIEVKKQDDPYSNLVVVGNNVFDKETRQFIPKPESKEGKDKILSIDAKYGVNLKDLSTKDQAALGIMVADLESQDLNPSDITKAINEKIIEIVNKQDVVSEDALNAKLQAADNIVANANSLMELAPDTGLEAGLNAIAAFVGIPFSEGVSIDNYVTQIKANLAFDRLQAMRDASKTGGALGNVSNIELDLLKSALTALNPSDKNFKKQLKVVLRRYESFSQSLRGQVPSGYKQLDGRLYQKRGNEWIDLGGIK